MAAKPEIADVQKLVLDAKRISPEAQPLRLSEYTRPILVRQDLMGALTETDFAGFAFGPPVDTI